MNKRGLLFIISGPAGSGKGTIVSRVRELAPFDFSVSATTRTPRPGEIDGVHYHFLTKEQFEEKIAAGEMLEHAKYSENYYGTPKAPVDAALDEGKNIILEIEVQGAMKVRELRPDALFVFIAPPSVNELRRRLNKRGTETQEVIEKRVAAAVTELPYMDKYDYIIVNDALEDAVSDFFAVIRSEQLKTSAQAEFIEEVIKNA